MFRIGCRKCGGEITLGDELSVHRFEKCACKAVLVESRGPLTIVYEFIRGSAVLLK